MLLRQSGSPSPSGEAPIPDSHHLLPFLGATLFGRRSLVSCLCFFLHFLSSGRAAGLQSWRWVLWSFLPFHFSAHCFDRTGTDEPRLLSRSPLCLRLYRGVDDEDEDDDNNKDNDGNDGIMRVTGPAVRRRNHAWLQMRSRERQAARLARRQSNGFDSSDDANTSGDDSTFSFDSSDDESDAQPTRTLRVPLPSATAGARTGRGVRLLPSPVPDVATGVTLGADAGEVESDSDGVESDGIESDGIESDGEESADESTAPPATATPPPVAAPPPPPPPAITSAETTSTVAAPPPPVTSSANPIFVAPPAPSSTSSSSSSSSSSSTSSTSSSTRTRTPPQAVMSTIVPAPIRSGSSSSLDELVTSLTRTSQPTRAASTTGAPSLSVPVTGSTQTEEAQVVPPGREANEREGDGLGMSTVSKNGLSSGAIAGILIGVLGMSMSQVQQTTHFLEQH